MQISWHGLSCFEIKTTTPSGEVTVVVDPYDNVTGLRFPRTLEAQLMAVSHDEEDANNRSAVAGNPFVVDRPGEYEVKGVFIYATLLKPDEKDAKAPHNLIFRFESEGMHIGHLGALNRALTVEELQALENIDILMIPVGGGRVLSPKLASEVISQIEPRVIIPMTHSIPNLKEALQSEADFCKAFGTCRREETNKYKVARKDLPEDDMLIVSLSRA